MANVYKVERQIGGRTLTIETGRMAKLSDGAVTVQYGETIVLVTACSAPPRSVDIDYFPLSVDYRERTAAAGKFPGGFMKREGRPTTKEVLTSRMIDRPIRPLFPDGYFDEVQVIATVLSADQQNDPDVLGMIGASAALAISSVPFMGPMGACRLGRINGEFVVNPLSSQVEEADLNLLLGGTKKAINMIEVEAKNAPEEAVAAAVEEAHKVVIEICDMIEELAKACGKKKEFTVSEMDESLEKEISGQIFDRLYELKQIKEKNARNDSVRELFDNVTQQYCVATGDEQPRCTPAMLKRILHEIEKNVVRKLLLSGKRLDGRGFDEVRPIDCAVGILPRTHGSALFSRGETQALVSITLGTIQDAQIIDGLLEEYGQKFMLHYNFPPYAVGEVKPMRGPGRREIGHGALAEKALEMMKPDFENFPYTIRIISDILESNGSSSMATVCGGTLAMLDAGIPIKDPVAGISIGLISEGNKYQLLTDIIGDEDHFGEMDFKIAGTTKGITAIQLDIKREGLEHNIMLEAMARAKDARLKILGIMAETISVARPAISTYAPQLVTIEIDPELIGKVIGPGGKMIKSIQEQTGSTIEIEEDGTVYISAVGGTGHLRAKEIIEGLTQPPKVGKIYNTSKVVSIKDFGAFVEFTPGVEGLCHISELATGFIKSVDEVVKLGDIIPVKLLSIDDQGRFKLSRKAALIELAKEEGKEKGGETPKA
ncbi:MAG: polyribonucleotide nucleotidyltransferase [Planctomycetes bacterium GWF2_50_10]|nr:MAG: polyribonucleotide nucleotidyltransferase [Planctomycetes bacterium GWF2_50_10]